MDKARVEELWSDKNEDFMKGIVQMCEIKRDQHEQAGYSFKKRNTYWGLPSVLIPTIMAPLSVLIDENTDSGKYINAGAFLLTGVITGVLSFFKYGEKMTNHFNFSSRYADVISDIDLELMKSPEFRVQLDVFSTRIHMITDSLANSEPVIPNTIVNNPRYKNANYTMVPNTKLEIDI